MFALLSALGYDKKKSLLKSERVNRKGLINWCLYTLNSINNGFNEFINFDRVKSLIDDEKSISMVLSESTQGNAWFKNCKKRQVKFSFQKNQIYQCRKLKKPNGNFFVSLSSSFSVLISNFFITLSSCEQIFYEILSFALYWLIYVFPNNFIELL